MRLFVMVVEDGVESVVVVVDRGGGGGAVVTPCSYFSKILT